MSALKITKKEITSDGKNYVLVGIDFDYIDRIGIGSNLGIFMRTGVWVKIVLIATKNSNFGVYSSISNLNGSIQQSCEVLFTVQQS